ncbi:hypothetical protein WR25_10269 [Diploscapter pachys]|uniref:Far11/STRP C-terminal domain-containing protein n=1 Tax=Diploscapter pachys TaxID=2018661 RepID=A0A2A2LFT4_9BILA|nr:hypothetical protein WR25_10269 [Diploscapter pachys]
MWHESTTDLDFVYADADCLPNELAELYSYSEMEDFAQNTQCWREYADRKDIDAPYYFSSLPLAKKQFIVRDLNARLESADPNIRLNSARILLYFLQGAPLDFVDEDDGGDLSPSSSAPPTSPPESVNKGTGLHESDCVFNGTKNAYLLYSLGSYQALSGMLLTEMRVPFDNGLGGHSLDGRLSKASSRDSRSASNADLSDTEKKFGRAATLADNESLRITLAALYHMVELIRNRHIAGKIQTEQGDVQHLQEQFLLELEEPLEFVGQPLLVVLFEMMPPFYGGTSPHFPIKKILLLIWKILLATLGGWEELALEKANKRASTNLPVVEDTIMVATNMPSTQFNDGESGVRMAIRRNAPTARMMSRQMACAQAEDGKEDDDVDAQPAVAFDDTEDRSATGQCRQVSGDKTPRAGSPTIQEPPRKKLPWKSKISQAEIEAFIQLQREKYFHYVLPGDSASLFGLPRPILASINIQKTHLYTSMSEIQRKDDEDLNRYLFSMKEKIEESKTESLYKHLLPKLTEYTVALLKVLLAAAPSNKAKSETLNILIDVLTSEHETSDILSNSMSLDRSTSNPLEDGVRLAIDINRHKEIIVKAASAIMILMIKHFKLNHVFQFEYICQHMVYGNGIPLILKFLDLQVVRHVQSRHEIYAYNYPQCILHFVRNGEEWPVLNAENVEETTVAAKNAVFCRWRNLFALINLTRVLNKLVKNKPSRVMMLMVFKSAPILKRALKIRSGIFQLYVLKALKMQSRYLGRQWRKSNMDIMSAIYSKVRHRLTDDWAFANEMRKSYDYHNEESELKASVERFHSRRYSRLYPKLAVDFSDGPLPGDDYLNRVDPKEFLPNDVSVHSVISAANIHLGARFMKIAWKPVKNVCGLAQIRFMNVCHTGTSFGAKKPTPNFEDLLKEYSQRYWDDSLKDDDSKVTELYHGLVSGSRSALASSITLVESRNPTKRARGNLLLKKVLDMERKKFLDTGWKSMIFRVGISGSPGVGKSSFIEALGMELITKRNMKVAVLTVDPTSAMTGGSLLGDLTRMQNLSINPRAYIRQSPTSGCVGGVTRGTHEAIVLCEAAGYDIVLVETVGVGQSEYAVADMCDMFTLLLSPAHGDELQGVKRGIMELSDLLVITKDDGDLKAKAKITQAEYISALKYMRPRLETWRPKVLRSSIHDEKSVSHVCDEMFRFRDTVGETGEFVRKRNEQLSKWMWTYVRDEIMALFKEHPQVARNIPTLESQIQKGVITPGMAAESLIRTFFKV